MSAPTSLPNDTWRTKQNLSDRVHQAMREAGFNEIAKTLFDEIFGAHPMEAEPKTRTVPDTDESAASIIVSVNHQLTEALRMLGTLREGITGKPYPLHAVMRTSVKHAEESLIMAMRDLRDFQAVMKEHSAHE